MTSPRTVRPPWWAAASSAAAPVFLIGGWTVAQARQPGFDAVRDTISALARSGLEHRWIMTTGLAGLGAAHVVTALGLRQVRTRARVALGTAGVATVLVAVFPQPYQGSSAAHATSATVAFVLLVVWPALSAEPGRPWPLRRRVAFAVTAVSAGLLAWFGFTLRSGPIGLSERLLAGQQAIWPLIVVAALRRSRIVDRHADQAHISGHDRPGD